MPSDSFLADLKGEGGQAQESLVCSPERKFFRPTSRLCNVCRIGEISYREAWDLQQSLVARRKAQEIADTLLLLEHPPVITLGRNAKKEHILSSPEVLEQLGIAVVETDRGGDVTYHGPGQLVGYPILDLGAIRRDVVWYVRCLEEAIIRTAKDFGLLAGRRKGQPGVWVNQAKVAAIGIHISRWVTSHGFALNLETDLDLFRHIVPCGIAACPVTSFQQLLGQAVNRFLVEQSFVQHFGDLLGLEMCWSQTEHLEGKNHAN